MLNVLQLVGLGEGGGYYINLLPRALNNPVPLVLISALLFVSASLIKQLSFKMKKQLTF